MPAVPHPLRFRRTPAPDYTAAARSRPWGVTDQPALRDFRQIPSNGQNMVLIAEHTQWTHWEDRGRNPLTPSILASCPPLAGCGFDSRTGPATGPGGRTAMPRRLFHLGICTVRDCARIRAFTSELTMSRRRGSTPRKFPFHSSAVRGMRFPSQARSCLPEKPPAGGDWSVETGKCKFRTALLPYLSPNMVSMRSTPGLPGSPPLESARGLNARS